MNEKSSQILLWAMGVILLAVLVFSILGYFRNGDIGQLESGIRDVGSGISDITERTRAFEESLGGLASLVNGVEIISNNITESVQQNARGLERFEQSIHIIREVSRRIQEEGVVLE